MTLGTDCGDKWRNSSSTTRMPLKTTFKNYSMRVTSFTFHASAFSSSFHTFFFVSHRLPQYRCYLYQGISSVYKLQWLRWRRRFERHRIATDLRLNGELDDKQVSFSHPKRQIVTRLGRVVERTTKQNNRYKCCRTTVSIKATLNELTISLVVSSASFMLRHSV